MDRVDVSGGRRRLQVRFGRAGKPYKRMIAIWIWEHLSDSLARCDNRVGAPRSGVRLSRRGDRELA